MMRLITLIILLVILMNGAGVLAQDEEWQTIQNCDGTVSLQIPQGWYSEVSQSAITRTLFYFGSSQVIVESSDEAEEGVAVFFVYAPLDTSTLETLKETYPEFDPATATPEILLTEFFSMFPLNEETELDMSHLNILEMRYEPSEIGYVNIVNEDGFEGFAGAFVLSDGIGIFVAVATPEQIEIYESVLVEIFTSFQSTPLPENPETLTYFSDDCEFQITYPAKWIAKPNYTGTKDLYLFNSEAAYQKIGYENDQPEPGMFTIRVHSPESLYKEMYEYELYGNPALVMEDYVRNNARGVATIPDEPYTELTVAGFPAVMANVDISTNGDPSEGVVLVLELGDDYALLFMETAPGERAEFEDELMSIAETIDWEE